MTNVLAELDVHIITNMEPAMVASSNNIYANMTNRPCAIVQRMDIGYNGQYVFTVRTVLTNGCSFSEYYDSVYVDKTKKGGVR